jgi:hypothetical protein
VLKADPVILTCSKSENPEAYSPEEVSTWMWVGNISIAAKELIPDVSL